MSDDVKKETHFQKKKLLTPVTVADKLVLVNPFVLCLMRCYLLFQVYLYSARH